MTTTDLKKMFKACDLAKRILEQMPQLPEGMKPRHLHVLEAIYDCNTASRLCRVSDVSTKLGVSTPGVTKLIQELERLGLVEKSAGQHDKRVSLVHLTQDGFDVLQRYVLTIQTQWAAALPDITSEQVQQCVCVLGRMADTLPGGPVQRGRRTHASSHHKRIEG